MGVQADTTQSAVPTGLRQAAGDAVIEARDLSKQFNGQAAVSNFTLSVPRGAILGLIGPSGCGKTTSIRLMTGIYEPTAGQIIVLGQAPRAFSSSTRRRLGYMPQQFVLYPNLSVTENFNFSASLYGLPWGRGRRLREMLEFVELYSHRNKLARQISSGMQRRLALATTLAHNPELLFLDEPTAGLDPVLRRKFWDYFQSLAASGRTLLISTQYVGEAAYCDMVGVMAAGRLLMVETPDGLRRRAYGGEIVDLRAAEPLPAGTVTQLRTLPFLRGPVQVIDSAALRVVVDDASTAIPALMAWSQERGFQITSVEKVMPPLDDVFVELVKHEPTEV